MYKNGICHRFSILIGRRRLHFKPIFLLSFHFPRLRAAAGRSPNTNNNQQPTKKKDETTNQQEVKLYP